MATKAAREQAKADADEGRELFERIRTSETTLPDGWSFNTRHDPPVFRTKPADEIEAEITEQQAGTDQGADGA